MINSAISIGCELEDGGEAVMEAKLHLCHDACPTSMVSERFGATFPLGRQTLKVAID